MMMFLRPTSGTPLTTLRQPIDEIGPLAVDFLQKRVIQPDLAPREVRLKAELIMRETTDSSSSNDQ